MNSMKLLATRSTYKGQFYIPNKAPGEKEIEKQSHLQ